MGTVKSGDKFVPGICLCGDKRPETVDLQGFDGFCPRVDTENMGTDRNENFVPVFSFCPRLSPEQENWGQNGPFENARKIGLF